MGISDISLFIVKVHRRFFSYIFPWIFKIKCIFTKKEIVTFKLTDGSDFDYPLRSFIGYALFCKDFENNEIAFLRRSLKQGDVFLDIGANGGIYTVIASKQVGQEGHVYAFEPGEHELRLLRHNIKLNGLTNVTVIQCAVSDKIGNAKFAVVKDGALNSLADLHRTEQDIESWQTVFTLSLDDFVCKYSIPRVDFIKIDVEGAEKLVFEGAKSLMMSDNRITILFESSDQNVAAFGYSTKQFLFELRQAGLKVYYIDGLNRLQSVNDENEKIGDRIYNFVTFNAS
jgi:FkbM family methyltransferase